MHICYEFSASDARALIHPRTHVRAWKRKNIYTYIKRLERGDWCSTFSRHGISHRGWRERLCAFFFVTRQTGKEPVYFPSRAHIFREQLNLLSSNAEFHRPNTLFAPLVLGNCLEWWSSRGYWFVVKPRYTSDCPHFIDKSGHVGLRTRWPIQHA